MNVATGKQQNNNSQNHTQLTFTCSKVKYRTLGKAVTYVQL